MKIKNQLWLQLLFSVVSLAFLIFVSWAFYALIQHWDLLTSRITIAATGQTSSNRDAVAGAAQAVGAVFQGTFGVAASLIGAIAAIFLGYASLKTSKAALIVSAQAERRENQRYATESLEQALKPFFTLSNGFSRFNEDLQSKIQFIWATAKVAAAEHLIDSQGVPLAEQDRRIFRVLSHPRVNFPRELIEQIRKQAKEVDGKKYGTRAAAWLATSEIAKSCPDICRSMDAAIMSGLDEAARNPYSNWLARSSEDAENGINFSDTVNNLRNAPTGTSLQMLAVDVVARSLRETSFYCLSTKEKAQGLAPLIAEMSNESEDPANMAERMECALLSTLGKGYIVRYVLEQRDDAGNFEKFMKQLPDEAGIKRFMSELAGSSPSIDKTSASFHQSFVKQFDDSFWNARTAYNLHASTRYSREEDKDVEAQRCAAFLLYQTPDTKGCLEELLRSTEEPQFN